MGRDVVGTEDKATLVGANGPREIAKSCAVEAAIVSDPPPSLRCERIGRVLERPRHPEPAFEISEAKTNVLEASECLLEHGVRFARRA